MSGSDGWGSGGWGSRRRGVVGTGSAAMENRGRIGGFGLGAARASCRARGERASRRGRRTHPRGGSADGARGDAREGVRGHVESAGTLRRGDAREGLSTNAAGSWWLGENGRRDVSNDDRSSRPCRSRARSSMNFAFTLRILSFTLKIRAPDWPTRFEFRTV
jgi:hypothetical protein